MVLTIETYTVVVAGVKVVSVVVTLAVAGGTLMKELQKAYAED